MCFFNNLTLDRLILLHFLCTSFVLRFSIYAGPHKLHSFYYHRAKIKAVCLYVCLYVCLSVCMHVCLYVSMYVCLYVSMSVCLSVYMYVCMSVWVYVSMHACNSV